MKLCICTLLSLSAMLVAALAAPRDQYETYLNKQALKALQQLIIVISEQVCS